MHALQDSHHKLMSRLS